MSCLITRWTCYYCQPKARLNNTPHAVLTQEHRELYPSCCQQKSVFRTPSRLQRYQMRINFSFPVTTWFAGPAGYRGWTQGSVLSPNCPLRTAKGYNSLSSATEDRSPAGRCSHQWRSMGKMMPEREVPSTHLWEHSFRAVAWSLFLFLWSGNFTLGKWDEEQLPGTTLIFSVPLEAAGWITSTRFGRCYGTVPKISHFDWKRRCAPWCTYHNSVLSLIQSFQTQHLQRATRS